MIKNQQLTRTLPATSEKPRPGSFVLGSPQSRAAARALLNSKLDGAKMLDFVISVVGCPDKFNPPIVGEWREGVDGTLTRISRIPWGMTIDEAERMVA